MGIDVAERFSFAISVSRFFGKRSIMTAPTSAFARLAGSRIGAQLNEGRGAGTAAMDELGGHAVVGDGLRRAADNNSGQESALIPIVLAVALGTLAHQISASRCYGSG